MGFYSQLFINHGPPSDIHVTNYITFTQPQCHNSHFKPPQHDQCNVMQLDAIFRSEWWEDMPSIFWKWTYFWAQLSVGGELMLPKLVRCKVYPVPHIPSFCELVNEALLSIKDSPAEEWITGEVEEVLVGGQIGELTTIGWWWWKPAGMWVGRKGEVVEEDHSRGTPSSQAIHCGSWVRWEFWVKVEGRKTRN